jgi:membrane protein implicated in regulation of membrane protease activity
VLVATHGWWPWLLTFAIIVIVIAFVIANFVKRRKTSAPDSRL